MIRVHITVVAPAAALDADHGEDWGEWDFISLPRAGDHVDIERRDRTEILKVHRVIHFAAQHPLPRSETPYRQRKKPLIRIVAARLERQI